MSSSPEEIAALMRGPMCQDCGGYLRERVGVPSYCPNEGCESYLRFVNTKGIGTPVPLDGAKLVRVDVTGLAGQEN